MFNDQKPIVGMVHLLPLPETPHFGGDLSAIVARVLADTDALVAGGVDALIIENFGDEPYRAAEPTASQLAVMTALAQQIRQRTDLPLGINVQFNAWQAEIALAYAVGAQFVRVEVFVDTVIAAQGLIYPCAADITRYRKMLGATDVQLWADIQTKYTQNLVSQALTQSAIDAQNAGADALIVTGAATGQSTPLEAVESVKQVVRIPVLVGSGTTRATVADVLKIADGAIVGSDLKQDGIVTNPVSVERTRELMEKAHG